MPLNKETNQTKLNQNNIQLDWFYFVLFYGMSTIVGYLIPNPLYTHKHR